MIGSDAQIITFYSYKGGTGRSMHLANIAWILASNGKRVLMVDWDLEAPGLHRYFQPFLIDKELAATDGLIDLMWDFSDAAMTAVPEAQRAAGWHEAYADLTRGTAAVRWPFPAPGRLDLLSAGRQGASYSRRVTSFNWQNFYDRLGGGVFLESLKTRMRKAYDYVLIDSRTGVTDTAGICTVQLPDALVLCFTANNQSIEGCAAIAQSVRAQWTDDGRRADHRRIVPLLTRVDGSEKDKLDARRDLVRARFAAYLPDAAPEAAAVYWRDTEVPYVPWYSYEEVLAVFADKYREKISVLDSAEALTRLLTHGEIASAVRPSDADREAVMGQITKTMPAATVTRSMRSPDARAASPYPGLRPFAGAEAGMFFGRTAEIEALAARLRAGERELYVVGPSGSGKSSLVRAGLVPLLERSHERGLPRFLIVSLTPGESPMTRLSALLEAPDGEPDRLGEAAEALLSRHPGCERLLIVIDQLEELFTLAPADQRAQTIDAIRALRKPPAVAVLLLVRSDFYGRVLDSPLSTDGTPPLAVQVAPLRGDALREAIVGPARAMGARVEPALVERLLADAAAEPGSLPLLQETLAYLWGRSEGGVLTAAQYAELGDGAVGGLALAMAHRAEAVYARLDAAGQDMVRRILLRLVSFGEGRDATRRRQRREDLAVGLDPVVFERTLQELVDQRLLTTDVGDDRAVQVDLASESLIAAWSRLRGWVLSFQADERRRRGLERLAAQWQASGRRSMYLLDPVRRREAVAWLGGDGAAQVGVSEDVRALVAGSRRLRLALWVTGFVVMAGVIVVVTGSTECSGQPLNKPPESSAKLDEARHQLASVYLAQGRALLVRDQGDQAAPYLLAARELGRDDLAARTSFRWASWQIPELSLDHRDAVAALAWSPDGGTLATATNDGAVRIWDAATGRQIALAIRHSPRVLALAWSADGKQLATAGSDGTAEIWAGAGKPTVLLRHRGAVLAVAWSPDGARIATASADGMAQIWDAATAQPVTPFLPHLGAVRAVAWRPDGRRLATASTDGTARIWDAASGQLVRSLRHTSPVLDAGWSPDGTMLATVQRDHGVSIWDAATGAMQRPLIERAAPIRATARSPDGSTLAVAGSDRSVAIVHQDRISQQFWSPVLVDTIAWSQDGKRIATTGDDQIVRIWDVPTGQEASVGFALATAAAALALNPDGNRVAATGRDGSVRLWRVRPRLAVPARLAHDVAVQSVAWSADGAALATVDAQGIVRRWDAAKAAPMDPSQPLTKPGASVWSHDPLRIATQFGGATYGIATYGVRVLDTLGGPTGCSMPTSRRDVALAITPDGTRLATYSRDDGKLAIWDARTCGSAATLSDRVLDAGITNLAWDPAGARIAFAGVDNFVRVWDLNGRTLASFTPKASVFALAWSPDGTRIATASADRIARIWNAASGALVSATPAHQGQLAALAWSPDGKQLATASADRTARVWNAASGGAAAPPLIHPGAVVALAWSPDGSRLTTAADDRGLRVWDAVLGQPLCPAIFHSGGITALAWSPDGTRVATASDDNFAQIWDLAGDLGSLDEWRHTVEASPYVLAPSGMLVPRELPLPDEAH